MDDLVRWGSVGLMLAAITIAGWWNRDTKAAVPLSLALGVLVLWLASCEAQAAEVRVGMGKQWLDDVGRDPAGVVWVSQRVGSFDGAYLHTSSIRDDRDRSTIDAPGVGYTRKRARLFLGRDFGRSHGPLAAAEYRLPIREGVLELAPMFVVRRGERLAVVSVLIVFGR